MRKKFEERDVFIWHRGDRYRPPTSARSFDILPRSKTTRRPFVRPTFNPDDDSRKSTT